MVNRTQMLVLGFFLLAVTSLLVILAAAPEVYDQALRLPTGSHAVETTFLAALVGFIALLGIGVVRRWRWTFWLVLVAFLAGVLRVPVAILQLTGVMAADTPRWYVTFQGCWACSSSPSAWPWWRAIVAPASGGVLNRELWAVEHQIKIWCSRSSACSARSTTRSMFCLALPGLTLTADPF
jgi:hypothetical protein